MIDTYSLAHKKLLDENYLWITTFLLLSPPLIAKDYSVLHNIAAKEDFDLFVGIFLVRIYCATFLLVFPAKVLSYLGVRLVPRPKGLVVFLRKLKF